MDREIIEIRRYLTKMDTDISEMAERFDAHVKRFNSHEDEEILRSNQTDAKLTRIDESTQGLVKFLTEGKI